MARVEVAPAAVENLRRLVADLTLPADTVVRVRARLRQLETMPQSGTPLEGAWAGLRFVLGPWRWMLVVYRHDGERDVVSVVTVQDGRTRSSARSAPPRTS